jgi:glycerol kinase
MAFEQDTNVKISELRVDGGPSRNTYLMQFQSNILQKKIRVPAAEELSGIGAAYAAGIAAGVYEQEKLFANARAVTYSPLMEASLQKQKLEGWKAAVGQVVTCKK